MAQLDVKDFNLEEAVKLIATACKQLKCSIRTRSKALIIYHQFKSCIGETKYDPNLLAAACISLSVKSNGENIELDAIIITFFCVLQHTRRSTLDEEFKKIKESLTMMECIILRMIDFDLNHRLAHELLIYFLFDIHQELEAIHMWYVIFELCLKISSDFYLSNRCLNYKPEELATSSIQAAFYIAGIDIDTSPHMKTWLKNLTEPPKEESSKKELSKKKLSTKEDIFEDIFKICVISPEAERRK